MLEALGAELDSLGLRTRLLIQAGRVPALHVASPAASQLSEQVCAAPRDGTWMFWWSWAEPIAAAAPEAAALISRVLRTTGTRA
jgi:hypothetical protein